MAISLTDPPDEQAVMLTVVMNNQVLRTVFGNQCLQFPSGGPALRWGAGVPAAATGANGDFYLRTDGAAGACIYQRRVGAWVATGA